MTLRHAHPERPIKSEVSFFPIDPDPAHPTGIMGLGEPADPTGILGLDPADPTRIMGPDPADPTGIMGLDPADPTGIMGLDPADPIGIMGLDPADPTGIMGLDPADSTGIMGLDPADPTGIMGLGPVLIRSILGLFTYVFVNPRRACAARVTVVGFVILSVKSHLTSQMSNRAINEPAYSFNTKVQRFISHCPLGMATHTDTHIHSYYWRHIVPMEVRTPLRKILTHSVLFEVHTVWLAVVRYA